MLEIFAILFLSRKNGDKAKAKGYSQAGFILLTIGLWVLGELIGFGLGSAVTEGLAAYIFAIIGAAAGGFASYAITNGLKDKNSSYAGSIYTGAGYAGEAYRGAAYTPAPAMVSENGRYPGSGLCDVCNSNIAPNEGYIVPVDVFYNSPPYKEWLKSNPLTAMTIQAFGSVDAYLANMRSMDHTPHSVTCPKCIGLFTAEAVSSKEASIPVTGKTSAVIAGVLQNSSGNALNQINTGNMCKAYSNGMCINQATGASSGPCSWSPEKWQSCGVVAENKRYYGTW